MNYVDRPMVLVADDDEDVLELVAFRLERTGYEVITAHDGEEALRGDESTRGIPVILLTAGVQESDLGRGFQAGANDYTKKPFSPAELRARVEAVLALSRPGG